jgi:hypothetical protein
MLLYLVINIKNKELMKVNNIKSRSVLRGMSVEW